MNTVCQRIMDQLQEAYYMNNLETSVEEKKKERENRKKIFKKNNEWLGFSEFDENYKQIQEAQ